MTHDKNTITLHDQQVRKLGLAPAILHAYLTQRATTLDEQNNTREISATLTPLTEHGYLTPKELKRAVKTLAEHNLITSNPTILNNRTLYCLLHTTHTE